MKIWQKFFGKKNDILEFKIQNEKDYKIFKNEYYEAIPSMIKEGYRPITTKELMYRRLKAAKSRDKEERDFWLNNSFRTYDAIAQYKNKFVIMPRSELLLSMAQSGQFISRDLAFKLTEKQFDELAEKCGLEEIPREYYNYCNDNGFEREGTKKHPIWIKLVQYDQKLLNKYTDLVFDKWLEGPCYCYGPMNPYRIREDYNREPKLFECKIWPVDISYLERGGVGEVVGIKTENLERVIKEQ